LESELFKYLVIGAYKRHISSDENNELTKKFIQLLSDETIDIDARDDKGLSPIIHGILFKKN
jgi:hypothetical protein